MMWCYRYNLHGISNLRDLRIEDYFNNTFLLKCLLKGLLSYEHCKSNKGVLFNQVICRKNFLTIAVEVCNADYECFLLVIVEWRQNLNRVYKKISSQKMSPSDNSKTQAIVCL